ncbi:S-layer homology domain-containing protein [Solibacillus daqui]|uniref:S-layer homology domain-containing protein n=1 Tax=Solibacillus daqui TaxID=2912187 RepID=UPI002366867C|nr:S-layer homology domain-containing protein [Solibacillus daqui]
MKKWLFVGALSLGILGATEEMNVKAAENGISKNVLSEIAAVEQNSVSFFDLYRVFKIAELNSEGIVTTMNAKKDSFIVKMPITSLIESEEGSTTYKAEYQEYLGLFGKSIQLKLTQHGKTFDCEIYTAGDWIALEGEDKDDFLAEFLSEDLQLRTGGHFTDTIGHWAESYIHTLYEAEVISGITATTFNPNGNVTRGQLVAMIYRASSVELDEQEQEQVTSAYSDLANFWGAKEVAILEKQELLTIFEGDQFEPNKAVTREEMAYVTAKFLAFEGLDVGTLNTNNTFKDIDKMNKDAVESIGLLQQLDIIGGENGQFNPKSNLTRAQFAKIFTLSLMLFEE